MQLRKIDDSGLFVEDVITDEVLMDENGTPDPHYIETPCPDGFYRPRWDGTQWVEGGTPPEEPAESIIERLKTELAATDYKIIKCYEYSMAGLELPYDIQALHLERQALRDQITQLGG